MAEEVKIEEKVYYRYRIFTTVGAIQALSEYATRAELWKAICKAKDTDGGPEFLNETQGVRYGIHIKPSSIIMMDDFYGQAPVVENPARPQGRSQYGRPARVVIGQDAKTKR